MMYDVYLDYKLKYPKEIVLIKSGTFYVAMNEDAFILYKIFDYKLSNFKHGIKIGFPSSSLGKVEKYLMRLHLSYVVVDKDRTRRKKARKNCYDAYSKGMDCFLDNQKRIQKTPTTCLSLRKRDTHSKAGIKVQTLPERRKLLSLPATHRISLCTPASESCILLLMKRTEENTLTKHSTLKEIP